MDFEELLKKLYVKWNASGKQIQIVAISGDENDNDYEATMKDVPWVCLPFVPQTLKWIKSRRLSHAMISQLPELSINTAKL